MDSARWLSYWFGGSPNPAVTLVDMRKRRVSIRDRMRSRALAMSGAGHVLSWSDHAALSWASFSSNSPSAQSTSPAVLTPSRSWPRISDIISGVLLSVIPISAALLSCHRQRASNNANEYSLSADRHLVLGRHFQILSQMPDNHQYQEQCWMFFLTENHYMCT